MGRQLISKKPEEIVQFQEARAFYEANRERLLAEYKDKYIAIRGGKVIDADKDFSRLAERVYRREGYRDFFMPKVEEVSRIISIPSPYLYN